MDEIQRTLCPTSSPRHTPHPRMIVQSHRRKMPSICVKRCNTKKSGMITNEQLLYTGIILFGGTAVMTPRCHSGRLPYQLEGSWPPTTFCYRELDDSTPDYTTTPTMRSNNSRVHPYCENITHKPGPDDR